VTGRTIMVVNPNTTAAMTATVVAAGAAVAGPATTVVGGTPSRGVSAVESNTDEVWGAVGVLEQVAAGERAGVDGYVIACFGDTGLAPARELARGPVVGMSEAALYYAAAVAARFTIITMPPRTREQSHRVLRHAGLEHRCTVRAIDEPVAAAAAGSLHLLDEVAAEARTALEQDGAEAVVLGCAGLSDLLEPLRERLGVPVIDGVLAGVTMVEGLLAMGLTTSRRATYAASDRLGPE
jgi:allantoin racemase